MRTDRYLGVAAALITLGVTVVFSLSISEPFSLTDSTQILTVGLGLAVVLYAFMLGRVLNRNPPTLGVALLGRPGVGKTVFLTVLFDELQSGEADGWRFSPYGSETIERVASDVAALRNGEWLAKTAMVDSFFFYRANLVRRGGFLLRRFKVEIADPAGEYFDALEGNEAWLHKSSFFKQAIRSDIVFFAVDLPALASAGGDPALEASLTAALQLLVEEKTSSPGRVLPDPVALLFLKADASPTDEPPDVLADRYLGCFVRVAEQNCQSFKAFALSSTGPLTESGNPRPDFEPRKVVAPLLWAVSRSR